VREEERDDVALLSGHVWFLLEAVNGQRKSGQWSMKKWSMVDEKAVNGRRKSGQRAIRNDTGAIKDSIKAMKGGIGGIKRL